MPQFQINAYDDEGFGFDTLFFFLTVEINTDLQHQDLKADYVKQ